MADLSPSQNAPAYGTTSLGTIAGLLALANDWPWYGALALVAVGLGSGLLIQRKGTVPR